MDYRHGIISREPLRHLPDLTLLNTITPTGANPNANVAFNYVLFGANNVDYVQDYRFYIDSMRLDYNESPEWPIMPTGAVATASVSTIGSLRAVTLRQF